MTAQLSPERVGRITGSRIAAILGVDRYRTRDDTMREMVRQALGAEPEFTGNEATQWGNDHEEDARAEYERTTGRLVLDAQDFVKHPEFEWIGVSPDGLVGEDGMAEFKAPYRARYRSITEKPEYEAQVQAQLAVTGRAWCHFCIYRVGEPLIIETVEADPEWLPKHLATLAEFHAEFLEIVADEKRAAPYLAPLVQERDDQEWIDTAAEFHATREAWERHEAAKKRLGELADGRPSEGAGVFVDVSPVTGSVDWKALAAKYAPDADPEEFRKAGTTRKTVKEVQA